ncbi:hypothetical protein HYQ46_008680 [Verticillium longisporum]|nr:hypothetical protein HYQ46_008680 [Verticillium longisporum]
MSARRDARILHDEGTIGIIWKVSWRALSRSLGLLAGGFLNRQAKRSLVWWPWHQGRGKTQASCEGRPGPGGGF